MKKFESIKQVYTLLNSRKGTLKLMYDKIEEYLDDDLKNKFKILFYVYDDIRKDVKNKIVR